MTDLAEMNKTQAETIKRQWYLMSRMVGRIERLKRSVGYLQRENDDLAARVAELECPKRRAEQYFTTEGQE